MERVLFLRTVDLFSGIAGEDLAPLATVAEEARFKAGDILIRQGEVGDGLYIIVDGEVEIRASSDSQIAVRRSGSVIGEMAVLSGQLRSATCIAASEVLALRMLRDDFLEMLAERPALALGIINILTQRLTEVTQRLANTSERELSR
ncbi:MAG TPA: cyclic nucleotide-binding domain-containing protein [Chloroflexota bacterium]